MEALQRLIKNLFQSRLTVHIAFCFVFISFFFVPVFSNKHVQEVLPRAFMVCFFLLGTTYAGRWCGKRWLLKNKLSLFVVYIILLLMLLSALISLYLYLAHLQKQWEALSWGIPLVALFLSLGVFLASSREALRRQMKDAEIADQQKQSELELLRSQLSPHFLFNTLNNLYGLSITQHEKIPSLIVKLSDLLRYSVYNTKQRFVPLDEELAYIWNYIELEKIRIGERLQLNVDIEGSSYIGINICPMMLIVFVENAFKHSKNSYDQKVKIDIRLHVTDNNILFDIANSCGDEKILNNYIGEDKGVGLSNTIRRLELLYPGEYRLKNYKEDNMYYVTLQLKAK